MSDYKNYSLQETFEMLIPKLEKNGVFTGFIPDDFKDVIAIVYKSGYSRGRQNKPYIIPKLNKVTVSNDKEEQTFFTNKTFEELRRLADEN